MRLAREQTNIDKKRYVGMKGIVKLYARPRLKSPNMLAAWPGIGDVAIIVASYLKRKLDFKELAEVEAAHFFDPIWVVGVYTSCTSDPFALLCVYYASCWRGHHRNIPRGGGNRAVR